ncbi:hypothetical protein I204_00958 [Kwoniella mangroviensis CBS 8886]|nr:hypothetical protein I204_00958 [Kwoniella mangroviensis CBS 8886]
MPPERSSGSTRTCQCPHPSHSAPTGAKVCASAVQGLKGCEYCVVTDGHSRSYHTANEDYPEEGDKWFKVYDDMLKWKSDPQTIRPEGSGTYWLGFVKHHGGYAELGLRRPRLKADGASNASNRDESSSEVRPTSAREVVDLTSDTPSTWWSGAENPFDLNTPYTQYSHDTDYTVPDGTPSALGHGSYDIYKTLPEFQGHFPPIQRPQIQSVTDMSIAPQWQDHFPPLGMQQPQQQQQQQAFDFVTEGGDTTMSEEDQKWWEENTRDFQS